MPDFVKVDLVEYMTNLVNCVKQKHYAKSFVFQIFQIFSTQILCMQLLYSTFWLVIKINMFTSIETIFSIYNWQLLDICYCIGFFTAVLIYHMEVEISLFFCTTSLLPPFSNIYRSL
ncbi:hypothetical protein ACJX0J_038061, partial [Zea mays]